jgi:hypothetical protein
VRVDDMRAKMRPVYSALGALLQSVPAKWAERYNLSPEVVRDLRARISDQHRELYTA